MSTLWSNKNLNTRFALFIPVAIVTLVLCLVFRSFWFLSILIVFIIVTLLSPNNRVFDSVSNLLQRLWAPVTVNEPDQIPFLVQPEDTIANTEVYHLQHNVDPELNAKIDATMAKVPVKMSEYGSVCEVPTPNNPFTNALVFSPMIHLEPCDDQESLYQTTKYFFNGPYKDLLRDPNTNLNYMKPWYTMPRRVFD